MKYITNISATTQEKRRQIKSLQDEFCTFSWGGVDAFENFGAFIINDKKGSLKFYNGPGFSNEYAKPQFDKNGGVLQGVTFNKQTISFTIGVYWISIEDYRKLLNWLDPLKIDYLQFGFDNYYRYDVKLSKIGDSTRWVVGRENGEPRYYTELQLTFELQTPYAKGIYSYEFGGINSKKWDFTINNKEVEGVCYLKKTSEFVKSDLETPVQVHFSLDLETEEIEGNYYYKDGLILEKSNFHGSDLVLYDKDKAFFDDNDSLVLSPLLSSEQSEYEIQLFVEYNEEAPILLCDVTLQNFAVFIEKGMSLHFVYFSETGLLFLQTSEQTTNSLLTLQTFSDTGDFLVKSLYTTKFMLPADFNYPGFYDGDLRFKIKYLKRSYDGKTWINKTVNKASYNDQPVLIECYPQTNII